MNLSLRTISISSGDLINDVYAALTEFCSNQYPISQAVKLKDTRLKLREHMVEWNDQCNTLITKHSDTGSIGPKHENFSAWMKDMDPLREQAIDFEVYCVPLSDLMDQDDYEISAVSLDLLMDCGFIFVMEEESIGESSQDAAPIIEQLS